MRRGGLGTASDTALFEPSLPLATDVWRDDRLVLNLAECPAVRDRDPLQNLPRVDGDAEEVSVNEPTSAEWVIGEWVTLDRELHPFEALELATVIEAVKLHVLHGWPRWWAWTFASLVGGDRHRHLGSSGRRACDRRRRQAARNAGALETARFTPTVHEMTILRVRLFGFRFTDVLRD